MERIPLAVGMIGAMLTAGLTLTAASLLQSSERFAYWKRTRQGQQGEIVPSAGVLRVGQTLTFAVSPMPATDTTSEMPLHNSAASHSGNSALTTYTHGRPEGNRVSARGVVGRVVEQRRGRLVFALEVEEITPSRTSHVARFAPQVGAILTLLVTGDSEMYRFEAKTQAVSPDPDAPERWLVTVNLPLWLARIQRRQHVRAQMQTGATLRTVTPPNKPNAACTEAIRCDLVDLSGGGLRLEVANVYSPHAIAHLCDCLPSGSVVDIDLDLPHLRGAAVRARIQSCQRIAARGGLAVRLRGEFIQLPSWQQEAILSHVGQA